ncbi:MAG TPA: methylmalonyl-CoA mutase family protein, partial [Xanthobacteraceae bacterium]|nr:methylmalonyl-CoA mutase family protein [Xanthobacteraceae bacterium]
LYPRAADASPMAVRTPGVPWQILQRVDHPDAAAANIEARHDLENGATGLTIVFEGAAGEFGYGLASTEQTIEQLFESIYLDADMSVEFDLGPRTLNAPQRFADFLTRKGIDPARTDIRFGFDPIGALAKTGAAPKTWLDAAPVLATEIKSLAAQGFKGPFAVADARSIHAAGGSEAQELAFAIAVALTYLRTLETHGIALDDARRMIFFRLAADADQFLTIAKFRALRQLWARVEEACGLPPKHAFVSAETAWRMMTKRDPWVNMLRTTIAAFSAGLGGADAITVLPFTTAIGLPDRFARRTARNTQLMLLEESNLAKVTDPSAGSGAIEELTKELAQTAWKLFQEIEVTGGAAAALEKGLVQQQVAAVRARRQAAVARRKDAITGTSEFPHLAEVPVTVLDVPPVSAPAQYSAVVTCEALPRIRLAEPFEQLRDISDQILASTGSRPKVFLANLGTLSEFSARATYAKNFFEAGGIEAINNNGFSSMDDLAAAFRASQCRITCLCSSDDNYVRMAAEAAKALGNAGTEHLYMAGRPGDLETALAEAGVKDFIYVGCDVLGTLQRAHAILKAAA